MQLECFPMTNRPPEMVPGRAEREWMDNFYGRHPYKCLPITMANTTGWEILCPMDFSAEWNGGPLPGDITLTPDRPHAEFNHFVQSHFAGGVLTFHPGYLFRTPPGWAVWTGGAPNHVKDGVQALSGLVETDWLPFPFTMNWIFTRPGRVRFKRGEPFCFITLMEHRKLEAVQPVMKSLADDPDLRGQFEAWNTQRSTFNARLADRDPETVKQAWQRFYFKGELPENAGPPADGAAGHVHRRRLKGLKVT
jgi:hypothetical protein